MDTTTDIPWHNGVTEVEGGFLCPCGLVWATSFLAIGCTYRNHVESFKAGGRPDGPPNAATYTSPDSEFRALRREDNLTITVTVKIDADGRRAIAEWGGEQGMASQSLCESWADSVLGQSMEAIRPIRVGR